MTFFILLLAWYISTASQLWAVNHTPEDITFSSLLYNADAPADASTFCAPEDTLRPLPEITSSLLADRSLLTRYDRQRLTVAHHILDAPLSNWEKACSLLTFIKYNGVQEPFELPECVANKAPEELFALFFSYPEIGSKIIITTAYNGQHKHLNCFLEHGHSLIHLNTAKNAMRWAIYKNQQKIVDILITYFPSMLEEAFNTAALTENLSLIKHLLSYSYEKKFEHIRDALEGGLYNAAKKNNASIMKEIIEWTKHTHSLQTGSLIDKAISAASCLGNTPLTLTLLEDYPVAFYTALQSACHANKENIIDTLLTHHFPTASTVPSCLLEELLFSLCSNQQTSLLEKVLSWAYKEEDEEFKKLLIHAACQGNKSLVIAMLHHFPSGLFHLLQKTPRKCLKTLLPALLDLNERTHHYFTPVHVKKILAWAIKQAHIPLIEKACTWYSSKHENLYWETVMQCLNKEFALKKQVIFFFLNRHPHLLSFMFEKIWSAHDFDDEDNTILLDFYRWKGPQGECITSSMIEEALIKSLMPTEATYEHYESSEEDDREICTFLRTCRISLLLEWENATNHSLNQDSIYTATQLAIDQGDTDAVLKILARYPHLLPFIFKRATHTPRALSLIANLLDKQKPSEEQIPFSLIENTLLTSAHNGNQELVALLFQKLSENHDLSQYQVLLEKVCIESVRGIQSRPLKWVMQQHSDIFEKSFLEKLLTFHEESNGYECDEITMLLIEESAYQGYQALTADLLEKHPQALDEALKGALCGSHKELTLFLIENVSEEDFLVRLPEVIEKLLGSRSMSTTAAGRETLYPLHPLKDKKALLFVASLETYENAPLLPLSTLKALVERCIEDNDPQSTGFILQYTPTLITYALERSVKKENTFLLSYLLSEACPGSEPGLIIYAIEKAVEKEKASLLSYLLSETRPGSEPGLIIYAIEKAVEKEKDSLLSYLLSETCPGSEYVEKEYIEGLLRYCLEEDFFNKENIILSLLKWRGKNNTYPSAEILFKTFTKSAERGRTFLLEQLLEEYSFVNKRHKKVLLLRKLPALPVENIMNYCCAPEKELTEDILIEALIATGVNNDLEALYTATCILSHLFSYPFTDTRKATIQKCLEQLYLCAIEHNNYYLIGELFCWIDNHTVYANNKDAWIFVLKEAILRKKAHTVFALLKDIPHSKKELAPLALETAALTGDVYLTKHLLKWINPEQINQVKKALYQSIIYNQDKVLQHFLSYPFPQECGSSVIKTLFSYAGHYGQQESLDILLSYYPHHAREALFSAAYGGKKHIIEYLLYTHDITRHCDKETPLQLLEKALFQAAGGGHLSLIKMILKWTREKNMVISQEGAVFAVQAAASQNNTAATLYLLRCYPHALPQALCTVATKGHTELLDVLLDRTGLTWSSITYTMIDNALDTASLAGHKEIIKKLLAWRSPYGHPASKAGIHKTLERILTTNNQLDIPVIIMLLDHAPSAFSFLLKTAFKNNHYELGKALFEWRIHNKNRLPAENYLLKAILHNDLDTIKKIIAWEICKEELYELLAAPYLERLKKHLTKDRKNRIIFSLLTSYASSDCSSFLESIEDDNRKGLIKPLLRWHHTWHGSKTFGLVEGIISHNSVPVQQEIIGILFEVFQNNHEARNVEKLLFMLVEKECCNTLEALLAWNKEQELLTLEVIQEALLYAIDKEYLLSALRLLLLSPELLDDEHITPQRRINLLKGAINNNHLPTALTLYKWPHETDPIVNQDIQEKALSWAIKKGSIGLTLRLLEHTPFLHARALNMAVLHNQHTLLKQLLIWEGPEKEKVTTGMIESGIHIAVKKKYFHLLKTLLCAKKQITTTL